MKLIAILMTTLLMAGCVRSQNSPLKIPAGDPEKPAGKEAVAYFGEGCFWHTEIVFQSLVGVRDAVSGYAGGSDASPDYQKVSNGNTGHAETVQVFYNPEKISFQTLVKAFFASHDPTQLNRQGNDVGTQYRSVAFYSNEAEKKIIEQELKSLAASKKYQRPIVTEVKAFTQFYPAESYHQEYILHHPDNTYVKIVSIPEWEAFKKSFRDARFKP